MKSVVKKARCHRSLEKEQKKKMNGQLCPNWVRFITPQCNYLVVHVHFPIDPNFCETDTFLLQSVYTGPYTQ